MQKIKSGNLLMIINIILPIVIVVGTIVLLLQNYLYNSRERVCDFSNATREGTSMIFDDVIVDLAPRVGDSGSWVSTNLCDNDGKLIYKTTVGTIYELELINNSANTLCDWSVMIRIPEEMCLNDAWDGEVELHQNVNSGSEQVQAIKIHQYTKYDITLEHYITHAGLMVKLYEGDHFVLFPNPDTNDTNIMGRKSSTVTGSVKSGFIVYIPSKAEDYVANFSAGEIHYHLHASIIRSPFFLVLFMLTIAWIISFITMITVQMNIKRYVEQQKCDKKIIEQTMQTIVNFIEAKDPSTKGHSLRVAQYSRMIAEKLGFSEAECEQVYWVALMHDCGKIYIPDEILGKPGKLTDEEYETMKKHTVFGGEILRDFNAIDNIRTGAMFHHERYDGKGYPNGLAGDEIPLIARIICASDAFDAMNSHRCYRNPLSDDVIIGELKNNRGTQFDPVIADCLLSLIESGHITIAEKTGNQA
ncbi:MAG: HD-GYP domain-containing protein [Lachnospiraceae bacterium]|nr:HD-GYP domain-containing protein [Lachnospiraceae bacterium]